MDPTDTNSAPSSMAASSSKVPPPDMEPVLTAAIKSGLTSNIKDALREIFLVGQARGDVLASVVGRALQKEDYAYVKTVLSLPDPYDKSTEGLLVDVNKLSDVLIRYAMRCHNTEEVLEMFLDAGLDVRKQFRSVADEKNVAADALAWAVRLKSVRLISQVLDKGADATGGVPYGTGEPNQLPAALHRTVQCVDANGYVILYPYLFMQAVQIIYSKGRCPRHPEEAIKDFARTKEISLLLMAHGAKLPGSGLLHSCATSNLAPQLLPGCLELAKAALGHGADVNELLAIDKSLPYYDERPPFQTPLIEAIVAGFPKMTELLFDNGADPSLVGHHGITAMGMALWRREDEMVALLKARGVMDDGGGRPPRSKWWKPLDEENRPSTDSAGVLSRRRGLSLHSD